MPLADAPESWGVRDQWLASIREQRRRELAEAAARGGGERAAGREAAAAAGAVAAVAKLGIRGLTQWWGCGWCWSALVVLMYATYVMV